jgi:hypothetical protein
MESIQVEKKAKPVGKVHAYGTLRVKKETRKRILQELSKINKKEFGRRVRPDDLINLALNHVTANDHVALQENSMSGIDRIKRDHRAYIAANGFITWDEYLWKRVNGGLVSKEAV